jgi:lysophospholipase L1-like esterase
LNALFGAALGAVFVLAVAVSAITLATGDARRALWLALARKHGWFAPRIIVAGDSLASGCDFSPLAKGPLGVLSLAKGGATLPEISAQLAQAGGAKTDIFIVDGGLNDLMTHESSPERIAGDFLLLLKQVGTRDKTMIFTLMPHVADRAYSARIDEANRLIAAICREQGATALDLNPHVSADGVRRLEMTNDGLHFTPCANAQWIKALQSCVKA